MSLVEVLTKARLVDTYEVYAAAGTTYWVDSTHYRITCPVGKRWFVMWFHHDRDAAETCLTGLYNAADDRLCILESGAAANTAVSWPNLTEQLVYVMAPLGFPLILDPGYYIETVYGGAQGVGAIEVFWILEVDL